MDLTTSCPTCGYTENASAKTCSFCGVDLDLHSDSQSDAAPADKTAGDEYGGDSGSERIETGSVIQGPANEKPGTVDEAVAHVLADEPIMELVEEVEAGETPKVSKKRLQQDPAAGAQGAPSSNRVEDNSGGEGEISEPIVMPESVQLQADEPAADSGASAGQTLPDSQKEELDKHRAALEKAEALKKRKLAIARAAALKQVPAVAAGIRIQKLLKPYLNKNIGINYDNSAVIAAAELIALNSEYLTVLVKSSKLRYHFPLTTVLSVIESADGNGVPTGAENEVFSAVVKIYPLVLF